MFSPSVRSRWATAMPAVAMMLSTLIAPAGAALGGPVDARSGLPLNRGVDQRVADFTLKDVASERPVSLYSFMSTPDMSLTTGHPDKRTFHLSIRPDISYVNDTIPTCG